VETLRCFVRLEAWLLLVAFILVIAYQLLTGTINSRGLLCDKEDVRRVSPARIQLLVLTLAGVFAYIAQMWADPTRLPDMSKEMVMALGGSNLFYAGGKARARLFRLLGLKA
jgi:hypothetical protein